MRPHLGSPNKQGMRARRGTCLMKGASAGRRDKTTHRIQPELRLEKGQRGQIRPHSAAALGDQDDEGGWLKLGLLEGNGKGLCRHSRQPRQCSPVDGSDIGPEEGALLKLGLLKGDEEG